MLKVDLGGEVWWRSGVYKRSRCRIKGLTAMPKRHYISDTLHVDTCIHVYTALLTIGVQRCKYRVVVKVRHEQKPSRSSHLTPKTVL